MATLFSSSWNSNTLGQLNAGIAALGRRDLNDALGAYGGFSELAEALSEINDGEFVKAAEALDNEDGQDEDGADAGAGVCIRNGAVLDRPDQDACEVDGGTWTPPEEEERKIIPPDIHKTFTTIITDLTDWAKETGKSIGLLQDREKQWDVWFIPDKERTLASAIAGAQVAMGMEVSDPSLLEEIVAEEINGDPLKIEKISKSFDRAAINEQYRDLHKDATKVTTTGGAGVLKQQMDYIAAAERAYRLRHATAVRCILHHSIRKEAHGHEVGVFQRVQMMLQDNLKASSPPPPDPVGQLNVQALDSDAEIQAVLDALPDLDLSGVDIDTPPEEA